MKCPFCRESSNCVIDSRLSGESDVIRRRRECGCCGKRFTTYERVEEFLPLLIKKDGRREAYDRGKLLGGVQKACEKRTISVETIEKLVSRIEQSLQEKGEREIETRELGERVMNELKNLDQIAYVRFASVYREFKDINEFMNELQGLLKQPTKK